MFVSRVICVFWSFCKMFLNKCILVDVDVGVVEVDVDVLVDVGVVLVDVAVISIFNYCL